MTHVILAPKHDSSGLFVNENWQPGTPGTFAVVIGVSDYPYLDGGSEWTPGDESYSLGQLHVSAATAKAFFAWLTDGYSFPAAPIAKCWLLLSPTRQELHSFGVKHVEDFGAAPATLANCELAIQSWSDAIESGPAGSVSENRSFFFFSGHGLEVSFESQVLLPSDYLKRPGRSMNDAISTANIYKGLSSSKATSHWIFADACRNNVEDLEQFVIDGRKILNERTARHTNSASEPGILYAAASGTPTWQPRELENGCTLFGTALLKGLEAGGVEKETCDGEKCVVKLYPLESYVKRHMAERLREFNSQEKATVHQGGRVTRAGITFVRDRDVPEPAPQGAESRAALIADRYDVTHSDLTWTPDGSFGEGHQYFGSERMTDIWTQTMRAYDLETRRELPPSLIKVREVRRSTDTKAFLVTIQLPHSPGGHWLSFRDPRERCFAISLAGGEEPPLYELKFNLEFDDREQFPDSSRRWISAFEGRLSTGNTGLLGRIAEIWAINENRNASDALKELLPELQYFVELKTTSELAATVAAVLLMKAHRLDTLPTEWLDNLSEWFFDNPDGPVLRMEQNRLAPQGEPEREVAVEQLVRLTQRGLPRMADLVPVAWRQLSELEQQNSADTELYLDRLRTAMKYYRPGGLFAVYASPKDRLDVSLVAGVFRRGGI